MMKEDEMRANVLMQTVHASPSWQAKAEVMALAAENCASVSNNNREGRSVFLMLLALIFSSINSL